MLKAPSIYDRCSCDASPGSVIHWVNLYPFYGQHTGAKEFLKTRWKSKPTVFTCFYLPSPIQRVSRFESEEAKAIDSMLEGFVPMLDKQHSPSLILATRNEETKSNELQRHIVKDTATVHRALFCHVVSECSEQHKKLFTSHL